MTAECLPMNRRLCNTQDDTLRLFNGMQVDLWSTLRLARSVRQHCTADTTVVKSCLAAAKALNGRA